MIFTNFCHLYLLVVTSLLAQLEGHMEGEQKEWQGCLKWQLSVLPHLLGKSCWKEKQKGTQADTQKRQKPNTPIKAPYSEF